MKLIDVNRLRDAVLALPNCYNGYSDTYDKSLIIGLIDEQIVVDAVPVVRCGDCKHSQAWYRDKLRCFMWSGVGIDVFEDGYCSYGERREDGVDC